MSLNHHYCCVNASSLLLCRCIIIIAAPLHHLDCCVTAPSLLLCDCIIITGVSLNHHYWCVSSSSYCHHHYIIIVRNMYSWADHSAKHELLSSPLCKTCLLASCCKQKSGGFPRNSNKSNHCYCVTASLLLLCHCIIIRQTEQTIRTCRPLRV